MTNQSLSRRELLGTLAASLAVPLAGAQAHSRRPNIVFIMADDLGYGDVGCYGQKHFTTPNIDKLASEGLRFTDAYAGCTVCAPSRSVLMTGKHMGHTSVRSNPGGVPLLPSDVTLAQILKAAGYRTGGFGKWGLGDVGTEGAPSKKGFDEFYGYLNQAHAHYYYPKFLYDNERESPLPGNNNGGRGTYSHDAIAKRALQFIENSKDQPFFCYMPFTIPHWELLVPEDELNKFKGKFEENAPFVDPKGHYADQPNSHAAYAAMITRMDRDIGRVLDLLKRLKLEDNTIVFFTSDNGSALELRSDHYFKSTGPFRGHKQNLYEGGIRVPMIARWPGKIAGGRVSHLPWAFYDVLPTLAELADATPPKGLDGISIVPELLGAKAAGRSQPQHEYLYWEFPDYEVSTQSFRKEVPMQALRLGDWKAVRPKPDGPLELYNLKNDAGETHDVGRQNLEVLAKVNNILKTVRVEPRPQAEPPNPWWGKSGTK